MGHYVLGHVWRRVLVLPLLAFFVLARPDTFQRQRAAAGGDNDVLARALLETAEYRYPRPHPWQEFVFHNHLSVDDGMKAAHRDAIAGRQADAAG